MICKQCGAQLPEGSAFCGACGAAVERPGFCVRCGAPLPEGAAFCGACGADQNAAPQPPKPKKKTARWLAAAAAVLAVCVGAVFLLKNAHGAKRFSAADTPQEALEQFYEAMFAGDAERAFAAAGVDLNAYASVWAEKQYDAYTEDYSDSDAALSSAIQDYRAELIGAMEEFADYGAVTGEGTAGEWWNAVEELDETDGVWGALKRESGKVKDLVVQLKEMNTKEDLLSCLQQTYIITTDLSFQMLYGFGMDLEYFKGIIHGGVTPVSIEELSGHMDNSDAGIDYILDGTICQYSYDDIKEVVTFDENTSMMAVRTADGWYCVI